MSFSGLMGFEVLVLLDSSVISIIVVDTHTPHLLAKSNEWQGNSQKISSWKERFLIFISFWSLIFQSFVVTMAAQDTDERHLPISPITKNS